MQAIINNAFPVMGKHDPLLIQFHPSNILTGADFAQPPHKSLLQKLVDFLRSKGHPL